LKHHYRLLAFPISVLIVLSAKGEAFVAISPSQAFEESQVEQVVAPPVEVVVTPVTVETTAPPVLKVRQIPLPTDAFWDKMAWCETHQDWQNGGQWAGGLGIYTRSEFPKSDMGTWERWGGEEFAPSPDKATREQQITIANRVAVLGWSKEMTRTPEEAERMGVPINWTWNRPAVGFRGWGALHCATKSPIKSPKNPPLFYHEDLDAVLAMTFVMGQEGIEVHDLQGIIGVKQDGKYGPITHREHLKYLTKNSLSTAGVPPFQ
jgi:hypothetical protein